jgi:hypothetical protein
LKGKNRYELGTGKSMGVEDAFRQEANATRFVQAGAAGNKREFAERVYRETMAKNLKPGPFQPAPPNPN